MNKLINVGIDIAKTNHYATIIAEIFAVEYLIKNTKTFNDYYIKKTCRR